jgi:hypothetical protein
MSKIPSQVIVLRIAEAWKVSIHPINSLVPISAKISTLNTEKFLFACSFIKAGVYNINVTDKRFSHHTNVTEGERVKRSWYSLVNIETGLQVGQPGFSLWHGLGIFLFATMSRLTLWSSQPPIQWILRALSLGIKWLGYEANHLPQSSTKIKNAWTYNSTSPYKLSTGHISNCGPLGRDAM